MASRIVLSDTSLCAIVRDEKMNPAGGIERFVASHIPYVEEAVIVDTGSVDGTSEILEELKAKYRNLRVVHTDFRGGYGPARNKALKKVKTKRALVLDADELLTHKTPQNDWRILKQFMEENPAEIYAFDFLAVLPKGKPDQDLNVHAYRLFDVRKDTFFIGYSGESLNDPWRVEPLKVPNVVIKHFHPSNGAIEKKFAYWYGRMNYKIAPSRVKCFREWKALNPQRKCYE